jgi:tRNA1(Val) A37 N6-methylase TrmN6
MTITDDAFLGGALSLLQPGKGYRAGVDAVFLAAAVPCGPEKRQTVLDVGAGIGTAGLCVARRCTGSSVTLLERQAPLVELARENISRNALSERVRVAEADIATVSTGDLAELGLKAESFDHVIANPPFHTEGEGTSSVNELKAGSHEMMEQGLELWCRFCARMAKAGGTATLIHKVEALPDLLEAIGKRFGALKVLPIQPRPDEPAIRVIVQGTKGSKAPLVLLPAAVLHERGRENAFTPGAARVLRLGAGLDLAYWKGFPEPAALDES